MEYTDAMKNRLKRIEGQVRGVLNMMERQEECADLVTQLNAVRSAVDRLSMYIVTTNLESCLRRELNTGNPDDNVIAEAVKLIMRTRG